MKKSLVTLSALLGLVLTGWADQTWKTSVATGLYSEPSNWTSAVPADSEFGDFNMWSATDEIADYEVTFPAAGFSDTSSTRILGLRDGQTLTFAVTNTFWYKAPGMMRLARSPLFFAAGGATTGVKDFFRLHNEASNPDSPGFVMSNAVLTCSYSTTGGSTVDFKSGYLNAYDPYGLLVPTSLNVIIGRQDTNVVFYVRPETEIRARALSVFGGRAEIEGGEHFFAGGLNVGGSTASYGDREADLNVADATLTLGDHFKIGTAEGQLRATARLSGTATIMASSKGTYVQAVKNANAFLEMSDQACITNNELRVGSPANGSTPGCGEMTMTDEAEVYTVSCRVGAGSSSGSYGSLMMDGSSKMLVDAPVNYALYVGSGENSTGVVTVAGNASLTVPTGRWVQCPCHAKAYGEINLCEYGRASIGNLYLGWPGRYALNLTDHAQTDIATFNTSWNAGGEGAVTVGSSAVLNVGGAASLGVHGPTAVTVRESGRMNVAGSVELGKNEDACGEIVVQDDATLAVGYDLKLGAPDTAGRVSLTVRDRATVTNSRGAFTKGPDTAIVLAGGSFSSTTAAGYQLEIYGSEGPTNGLLVTDGDHALVYANGVKVVSDTAATAATTGRVDLLGGRVKVKQMFGGAGSTAGGGKGCAVFHADGATLEPSVTDETFLEKFDVATLGASGLTVDVPANFADTVRQAFADADDADGLFVKAGAGTLTAAANSAHAVTRVEQGVLAFGAGVTQFGRAMAVTGGTLDLTGREQSFGALQLGAADATGTILADVSTRIIIPDASKFSLANAVIRLSSSPEIGTYDLFEITGAVDPEMFDGLVVIDPDGGNRYGFVAASEGGVTSVRLRVENASSIEDVTWNGTVSGAWTTDGNWAGGVRPTAFNNAVLPAEATEKAIDVDSSSIADTIKVTGGDYSLSGVGVLANYGLLVTNGATADVSVPMIPKGVFTLNVAEGSRLDFDAPFAQVAAGELRKAGKGLLALGGAREKNGLGWNLCGGRTTVTNDAAIGGPTAGVTLGACTLGFPEGGTYVRDVALNAGTTDQFSVMDVAQDTVISGALDSVSGAFIKRGTGTLEVDYPAGMFTVSAGQGAWARNIVPTDNKTASCWTNEVVFPANGESPDIFAGGGVPKPGLGGFNVAEGLVRLRGDSATTLAQTNWTVIGVNCPEQAAEAELEIAGLTFDNSKNTDYRRFVIGQRTHKDVPFRHPTLRIVDGALVKAQGLFVGSAYDVATYPTLAITNARMTVDSQIYINTGNGNNANCWPIVRIGPGGELYSAHATVMYGMTVGQNSDIIVDGGLIEANAAGADGLNVGYCACGTVVFRNGGTLKVPAITSYYPKNTDKRIGDFVMSFDGGVLELTSSRQTILSDPDRRWFELCDGGLEIKVGEGLRNEFNHPFRGDGALTKTGAGEMVFGRGLALAYERDASQNWHLVGTNDTDAVTAAWTGKTTVAEGTLTFEEGELVATKEVEVAAGATLELSNAETAYGFETLSGAGTIRNGTIGRCAIACDGTSALTFDNVTLGTVTVDFGHDETDPIDLATLAGLKVAQLANGSTATKWKIVGTGHKNARGSFAVQDDGSVVLTEACVNGLLMIVR